MTTVAVGGYLMADAASDTPDAPEAGSSAEPPELQAGKANHRQAEQDYLDSIPADQRPYVSRDRTFVDPNTGKRFRPDIANHETGDVIEYKPKTHQDGGPLQRDAERQAKDYADHLNHRYGDQRQLDGAPPYHGRVVYY